MKIFSPFQKAGRMIFAFVLLASCKGLDKYTQFELPYDQEVVIPSSLGINLPFNVVSPDVTTNSESSFSVNDTRKDLIEKITLTQLSLSLTQPAGQDFSFLKSIEVFLNADSLPEIKIAWNTNVSANAASPLDLELSNADLKEYIKKDVFRLRVNTVTDEILTSDHHVNIHSKFFVDAELLGQ